MVPVTLACFALGAGEDTLDGRQTRYAMWRELGCRVFSGHSEGIKVRQYGGERERGTEKKRKGGEVEVASSEKEWTQREK